MAGQSGKDRLKEEKAELAMTPMIDVVFLLLIFFMTATKFKTSEGDVQANLPKDRGSKATMEKTQMDEVRIFLYRKDGRDDGEVLCQVGQAPTFHKVDQTKYVIDRRRSPNFKKVREKLMQYRADFEGSGKKSEKGLPVKIDAKENVPLKFLIRAINACIEAGVIDNMSIARQRAAAG